MVLVYLLMVVNFQSWLDPLVILMALPGALSGIAWMLFVSRTTLSVPSLMGHHELSAWPRPTRSSWSPFANDQRAPRPERPRGRPSPPGITRLRPVVMTALAMIIGNAPMSLGLGEGGEQNAPLGRAVIGGLTVATFSTLFFVPIMYSVLRRAAPVAAAPVEGDGVSSSMNPGAGADTSPASPEAHEDHIVLPTPPR